jgi:hypothetical protein
MAGIAGIHEFLDSDRGFDDEILENSGECEATEDGLLQRCNLNNVENDHISLIEPSKEGLSAESLEPCIGMTFSSLDGARDFYYDYAKRMGFTIRTNRIRHSLKNMAIIGRDFVCSREGFRAAKHTLRKDRVLPPRPITREGCKAMIRLAARDGGIWIVTKFEREHNHKLMTNCKFPGELPIVNILSEVCLMTHIVKYMVYFSGLNFNCYSSVVIITLKLRITLSSDCPILWIYGGLLPIK